MPAACSFSGRLSTRNASITISCVAEAVATSNAPSATINGERAGSVRASSRIAAINSSCVSTSRPRRRPNTRDSSGIGTLSISGAQRNFSV